MWTKLFFCIFLETSFFIRWRNCLDAFSTFLFSHILRPWRQFNRPSFCLILISSQIDHILRACFTWRWGYNFWQMYRCITPSASHRLWGLDADQHNPFACPCKSVSFTMPCCRFTIGSCRDSRNLKKRRKKKQWLQHITAYRLQTVYVYTWSLPCSFMAQ